MVIASSKLLYFYITAIFTFFITLFFFNFINIPIVISLILILLGGIIIIYINGSKLMLSPSFIYFVITFIMIYLGSIVIYYKDGYDNFVLYYISLSVLVFSLGSYFANKLSKFNHKEIIEFKERPFIIQSKKIFDILIYINFALCIIFAFIMFYFLGIPLFGTEYDFVLFSQRAKYLNLILFLIYLTCAISISKSIYLYNNNNNLYKKYLIITIVIYLCSFIILMLYSRRYPLFELTLVTFIIMSHKIKKFSSQLKLVLTAIIIIIITIYILITANRFKIGGYNIQFNYIFDKAIVSRLISIEASAVIFIFDRFPSSYDYFLGKTIYGPIKSKIDGTEPEETFGNWLFKEYFSKISFYGEKVGYLPPTLIGEFYANFGPYFIVFLFIWGIIIQYIYIYFIRNCKTVEQYAFYSIIIVYLGKTAISNLYNVFYAIMWIFIIYLINIKLMSKIIP